MPRRARLREGPEEAGGQCLLDAALHKEQGDRSIFENFIDGGWVTPKKNRYLTVAGHNSSVPTSRVPRSSAEDVEHALDAAHRVRSAWFRLRPCARALGLACIADQPGDEDRTQADCRGQGVPGSSFNRHTTDSVLVSLTAMASMTWPLQRLLAECVDQAADRPVGVGFSAVVKLVHAGDTAIEAVYRQMIPLLLYGHVVVAVLLYEDARNLPVRLLAHMALMAECLPPGVLNLVNGLAMDVGIPLANSPRALSPEMVAAQSYQPANCAYRRL